MDPRFWTTYVLVPLVAGVLCLRGAFAAEPSPRRAPAGARTQALVALILLASAGLDAMELVAIQRGINVLGKVVFVVVIACQVVLALLAAVAAYRGFVAGAGRVASWLHARLAARRRLLGGWAIASAVLMVLVRARVWLRIFS